MTGGPVEPDGTLDLAACEIAPGEARGFEVAVPAQAVTIGGNEYTLAVDGDHVAVDVTHTHSGWHIRARGAGVLTGPCWRCLDDARVALGADLTEFSAFDRDRSAGFDEDLDSEYLEGQILNAGAMARDALLEALPASILCRDDCRGLCPQCGTDLNDATCDCVEDTTDPRWDALRGLVERLEDEEPGAG